ncbi:sensor histidine kinase [Streptomyces sp. CA-132043]|uniref:sensor histidine kinase n=1 Tax=Streptomyces sp. CA-132043 TaxID=3240048 RepID=UPI003D936A84
MEETTRAGRRPVSIGQAPVTRREALAKSVWVLVWLAYLGGPVGQLASGRMTTAERAFGTAGLIAFCGVYCLLLFRKLMHGRPGRRGPVREELSLRLQYAALGVLAALAVPLALWLGPDWLVLFAYVGMACAAVLPWEWSRWAIPAVTAVIVLIGWRWGHVRGYLAGYALPALLGGFAMVGIQQLIRTTDELRQAREEVARLAADEERLRLARDLHDLLGHSLPLITLKSELAGRLLPDRPEDAARQVADVERVGRQALVDVREAVTGYRRPRLAVELAGARAALRAAGITAEVDPALERYRDLPRDPDRTPGTGPAPEAEGALAWALREAVTNVVRHSGARRCELLLSEEGEADERRLLCLAVLDDGTGPPRGHAHGNGLNGLGERLALADGRLETGRGPRGRGFALRAYVPLGARSAGTPPASVVRDREERAAGTGEAREGGGGQERR